MTRRSRIKGSLLRKRKSLKKEALGIARSAAGLTPLGIALNYHDLARRAPRLTRAAGKYADELVGHVRARVRRTINRWH